MERAGINVGRIGNWGELVLGRIDWHPEYYMRSKYMYLNTINIIVKLGKCILGNITPKTIYNKMVNLRISPYKCV